MSHCRNLWALLLAVVALGCSKGPSSAPVQAAPSADKAKGVLEQVVKTGVVGSGLDDVESYLNQLKKTDPTKADPLMKDLNALTSSSGRPDQAKAKAKGILTKL